MAFAISHQIVRWSNEYIQNTCYIVKKLRLQVCKSVCSFIESKAIDLTFLKIVMIVSFKSGQIIKPKILSCQDTMVSAKI